MQSSSIIHPSNNILDRVAQWFSNPDDEGRDAYLFQITHLKEQDFFNKYGAKTIQAFNSKNQDLEKIAHHITTNQNHITIIKENQKGLMIFGGIIDLCAIATILLLHFYYHQLSCERALHIGGAAGLISIAMMITACVWQHDKSQAREKIQILEVNQQRLLKISDDDMASCANTTNSKPRRTSLPVLNSIHPEHPVAQQSQRQRSF